MYRVCVGYVSGMYRVCIGIDCKGTTFFPYMQISYKKWHKKIATYVEHKWRSLFKSLCIWHQIFRLIPAKKVRGVAGP